MNWPLSFFIFNFVPIEWTLGVGSMELYRWEALMYAKCASACMCDVCACVWVIKCKPYTWCSTSGGAHLITNPNGPFTNVINSHEFALIGWDWILRVNFLFSFDIKPLTHGPSMIGLDDLIGLRILDKGRAHPNLSISHLPTPKCGPYQGAHGHSSEGHTCNHSLGNVTVRWVTRLYVVYLDGRQPWRAWGIDRS